MKTSPKNEVFGLPIRGLSRVALLTWIEDFSSNQPKWVVTANPEILLEAHKDPAYAAVLRQADLLCVDGTGLWAALKFQDQPVERVTGMELAGELVVLARKNKWKIALIGGGRGVAAQAAKGWTDRYPDLQIIAEEGGRIARDGTGDLAEEEAVHRLVLQAPEIILVAFGHPRQERWIARRIGDFPSLKVIVGVGGTFDVWSGRIPRAPAFLRSLGLEWSWRLVQEPYRVPRILRAILLFPLVYLVDQLKTPGEARKRGWSVVSVLIRLLFFFFALLPALIFYIRLVARFGITGYPWRISDIVIPIVLLVTLVPVFTFFRKFTRTSSKEDAS